MHQLDLWLFIRHLSVTVLLGKKRYSKPRPHPLCSSSSRHLREAIRTSPQPGLSQSGLSLSWRWAKLPQSHRSEPARPSLPRDSLSLIDGIRTGQRARSWPGQRDILYSLTLCSSTLPPSLPISLTFRASQLFSCDPQTGERCNLSPPRPQPSTPTAFLQLPPTLPARKHTHRSLPSLLWHGADGLFFKLISKMYISSRSPSPDYLLIFNMKSSLYKQELQHKKLANLCINPLIEFPEPVVLHFLIKSISFFKGCCVICMLWSGCCPR